MQQSGRTSVLITLLFTLLALGACGDDKLIRVPQGRSGGMEIAGSVRAQSPHYRLIGTLGAAGGPRASKTHQLQDGVYVNGKE